MEVVSKMEGGPPRGSVHQVYINQPNVLTVVFFVSANSFRFALILAEVLDLAWSPDSTR